MNRRGFLATAVALLAAPFVRRVPDLGGADLVRMRRLYRDRWKNYYVPWKPAPGRVELMAAIKRATGTMVYIPPFDESAHWHATMDFAFWKAGIPMNGWPEGRAT